VSDLRSVTMRQRKLAIVLLDLIGSTAFVQRNGAVRSALHFQRHDRLARNLCYKFNGREIDRSDGFLLSFEGIVDAVNFALHYQRSIPQKTGLQARIGIHWGPVVEVQQSEVYVGVGAKKVELEGLSKNIAARTMSLCEAGQVLLTAEAMEIAKGRTNRETPSNTRYFCVGDYRFKGVRKPQKIYAVGESVYSLRPPKGSDKAKKVNGPKKTKHSYKDMTLEDWKIWGYRKSLWLTFFFYLWLFHALANNSIGRDILGMPWLYFVEDIDHYVVELWGQIISFLKAHTR